MPTKSPIKSKKHYIQTTLASVSAGAIAHVTAVTAIEGAMSAPDHVREGDVVKAAYFEYWLQQGTTSLGSFTAIVYKCPGAASAASAADLAALHDWDNKKNVLYTTQGIAPANDANAPLNIIKGWVQIPKGKQRFGLNDRLFLAIRNNNGADAINYCGFVTLKSYS